LKTILPIGSKEARVKKQIGACTFLNGNGAQELEIPLQMFYRLGRNAATVVAKFCRDSIGASCSLTISQNFEIAKVTLPTNVTEPKVRSLVSRIEKRLSWRRRLKWSALLTGALGLLAGYFWLG
jgi:hypothetical protein